MKKQVLSAVLPTCCLFGLLIAASTGVRATLFAAGDKQKMQSTRADFKEYCDVMQGRWIGKVVWIADWPGFGKKGDTITAYRDVRVTEDGNALLMKFHIGPGTGTVLCVYDAGDRQIKFHGITSGGAAYNSIVFKDQGKWRLNVNGTLPDGKRVAGLETHNVSDDGTTHTQSGVLTIGGEKTDPLQDVWTRLKK